MKKLTKVTSATVKIMLSHDYNHFESSMMLVNEGGVTTTEIDNARKDCNRLCNQAIEQYKIYKRCETKSISLANQKIRLQNEVKEIESRPKKSWSVEEQAKVKALADHNWNQYHYDFEDDFDFDNL